MTKQLSVETGDGAPAEGGGFASSVKGMGRRASSVFGFGTDDGGRLSCEEPHSASRIDALRRSGSFQGRAPFDAFDELESGTARELVTEECLSPAEHDTNWTHCYLVRSDKTDYKMYAQKSHRFLLSAKKVGEDFFISQYEDFPVDEVHCGGAGKQSAIPRKRYCAVLRGPPPEAALATQPRSKRYRLWLCGCEDPIRHQDGANPPDGGEVDE